MGSKEYGHQYQWTPDSVDDSDKQHWNANSVWQ